MDLLRRFYQIITGRNGIVGLLGFAATIVGILQAPDAVAGFLKFWNSVSKGEETGTLPLTHPHETWKKIGPTDIQWLQGTWCYIGPAAGLYAKYRVTGDAIEKEDIAIRNKWVRHEAYISNMNTVRLTNSITNITVFLTYDPKRPRVFLENTRRTEADGRVRAGDKFLAVDCRDCRNSKGLGSYDCRPPKTTLKSEWSG